MVQPFVNGNSLGEPRFLDFPYAISGTGVARTTSADDHLRDLVAQVLLTNPGERINLPEFGVGVQRLVFAPNGDALRSTIQFLITTNLQRWLGDKIIVDQVAVIGDADAEGAVIIDVAYTVKTNREQQRLQLQV